MKRKYLQFSNKVLAAAIVGLVGGLASCNYLVKYGAPEPKYGVPEPEDTLQVLYGPAPVDSVNPEYIGPMPEIHNTEDE